MRISDVCYPMQTVLVTCKGKAKNVLGQLEERDNIITIAWHMPASFEPSLFCIAVGKARYSLNIIRTGKVFCVNFMPYRLKKEVLFCGMNSGEKVDKFKEANLKKIKCEKIDCPCIKEADGHLECEVIQEIDAGDHVIFVGKVLHGDVHNNAKRLFHVGASDFTTTEY